MNLEEAHYLTELEDQIELQNAKIRMLVTALEVAGLHTQLINRMLDEVTL